MYRVRATPEGRGWERIRVNLKEGKVILSKEENRKIKEVDKQLKDIRKVKKYTSFLKMLLPF